MPLVIPPFGCLALGKMLPDSNSVSPFVNEDNNPLLSEIIYATEQYGRSIRASSNNF